MEFVTHIKACARASGRLRTVRYTELHAGEASDIDGVELDRVAVHGAVRCRIGAACDAIGACVTVQGAAATGADREGASLGARGHNAWGDRTASIRDRQKSPIVGGSAFSTLKCDYGLRCDQIEGEQR